MSRLYIHGVGTMSVGHEKPFSEKTAMLDELPIKDYVSPKKSRRFGRLSKIYYIAAIRALENAKVEDPSSIPIISATCAGETGVSLALIEQIHQTRGRIVSPALVPNSVHNSPAGYLSIGLGNHSPSITVSQGWLSSEAAVATASHWVAAGVCERVLVISGDESDLGWAARLREHHAFALADALESEALQEGAVGLVLVADVRVADCTALSSWWDGRPFERVLADVPCTGSGVVRRHPDMKWLRRSSDVGAFASRQHAILEALWRVVAPGGKLLYVTCSVFRDENEAVLDAFVARLPDAAREDLPGGAMPQLLPCAEHDGFFFGLLKKTA